MNEYKIIRRPLVTEKSTINKEANNQLAFEVAPRANKVEIRRAIELIFNVRVLKVRTIQVIGKKKRVGRILGKRRNWKKAIVTLGPGERIEFFEGA
ncbi:MAG: 50S ribosomal protein L23 [Deltaproteobacteria bacterium]|nr:50S ribosomal protein L23 [Deltaproteobacteria bacterium]